MKEKTPIKKILTLFPILGLSFLLLFSACSVRNFIQSELGISITKVSNKSKSNVNNIACSTYETDAITVGVAQDSTPDLVTFQIARLNVVPNILALSHSSFQYTNSRNNSVSEIPLYILYKNLKVYS